MSAACAVAAIKTLQHLGYTYNEGAELWKPPLGKQPCFHYWVQHELGDWCNKCFSTREPAHTPAEATLKAISELMAKGQVRPHG